MADATLNDVVLILKKINRTLKLQNTAPENLDSDD